MKPINWPFAADALAAALGIKGRMVVRLDETAAPGLVIADLSGPPYGALYIPAGLSINCPAGGVGVYSGAAIRVPGPKTVFGVEGFNLVDTAGAGVTIRVMRISATQYSSLTIGTTSQLSCFNPGRLDRSTVATTIASFTHNAFLGTELARLYVPAGQSLNWAWPEAYHLYTDQTPGGALALFVMADNTATRIGVYGREYPVRQ